MIIIMKTGASKKEVDAVIHRVEEYGFNPRPMPGEERMVIACIGHEKKKVDLLDIHSMDGVEALVPISKPFKLASSETKKEKTVIKVGKDVLIGGKKLCIMAGPCSVESREQIISTAKAVKLAGAHILRGGAYKPRTSPYEFQGLEEEGLKLLAEARKVTGLPIVTEVLSSREIEVIGKYTDIFQVGARNIQNFALLKELGKCKKPVFLKRGMASTIKEWLLSAEYILAGGNEDVILCERGVRTFSDHTRNTLDLSVIPVLKELTHLPIIIDPSHATGNWKYVPSMSLAAIAAGADGIMVEVHPQPEMALSDGGQSLNFSKFEELMTALKPIAKAVGRIL